MSGDLAAATSTATQTLLWRGSASHVAFDVLGRVGITVDGRMLPLPSTKMRYLTAALLLHGPRGISLDRLICVLWNDSPPASARKNLHQYVHRLRNLLAGFGLNDRLMSLSEGYLLQRQAGELDLERFEALAADGRRARERRDLPRAHQLLSRALAVWRDDALVDVRGSIMLDEAAQALAEQRMAVLEERIAIDLQSGRHDELVPELAALVVAHPLRERLREYQILALYASGRKADALSRYQECREVFGRELGVDPGPALAELHMAILRDDDAAFARRLSPAAQQLLPVVRLVRRPAWRKRPGQR